MKDTQLLAYVQAAASAVDLPLEEMRVRAVAVHLGRSAAMARLLDEADLSMQEEPAEVFRPAPFPAADDEEMR
jgi:hypothetical protein